MEYIHGFPGRGQAQDRPRRRLPTGCQLGVICVCHSEQRQEATFARPGFVTPKVSDLVFIHVEDDGEWREMNRSLTDETSNNRA